MSDQGYLILGTNIAEDESSLRNAYALGLTLKLADPNREVGVVVEDVDNVPDEFNNGFDYIVELPFGRSDIEYQNHLIDFWQLYYCTPFKETIAVSPFALATDNIAMLWDMPECDMCFGTPTNFRHDNISIIDDRIAAQYLDTNYGGGIVYFKESEVASEFFKMADAAFKCWRDVYREFFKEVRLDNFDFDLMLNTVAKMIGETFSNDMPYVDLTVNFLDENEKWMSRFNYWITPDIEVKVNNFRQTGIVCYGKPEFLDDDMIEKINAHYKTETTKTKA